MSAESNTASNTASNVEQKRARRQYVAPLFAYCADHCIAPLKVARRAAMRQGTLDMNKVRLSRIKLGYSPLPEWFIAGMCREIGQPIEVVMGTEWAQRHLTPPLPTLPTPATGATFPTAAAS